MSKREEGNQSVKIIEIGLYAVQGIYERYSELEGRLIWEWMVLCASNAEEGYQKLHTAQIAYIANVVSCFLNNTCPLLRLKPCERGGLVVMALSVPMMARTAQ